MTLGLQAMVNERLEELRDSAGRFDEDNDGTISFSEVRVYLKRVLRTTPLVSVPLQIAVLPLVALFPPLESIGARSEFIVFRAFNSARNVVMETPHAALCTHIVADVRCTCWQRHLPCASGHSRL